MMIHDVSELITIFNECFQKDYQTILVRGGDEPLYVPANSDNPYHQVIFARGFFSSALHEIAHWLIAGSKRRLLEDYGYWYIPDGRNEEQQKDFEKVEIKPQALEWILSDACQFPFQISVDNLNGPPMDIEVFRKAILLQKQTFLQDGLSHRTQILCKALQIRYHNNEEHHTRVF
jgi:elongation factor P hydroxylase